MARRVFQCIKNRVQLAKHLKMSKCALHRCTCIEGGCGIKIRFCHLCTLRDLGLKLKKLICTMAVIQH